MGPSLILGYQKPGVVLQEGRTGRKGKPNYPSEGHGGRSAKKVGWERDSRDWSLFKRFTSGKILKKGG